MEVLKVQLEILQSQNCKLTTNYSMYQIFRELLAVNQKLIPFEALFPLSFPLSRDNIWGSKNRNFKLRC